MSNNISVPLDENLPVAANSSLGKTFPGGPSCIFHGKAIPALITCTTNDSITSEILKHAFERLDRLDIFPFYIDLPNNTHKWQLGGSEQQNEVWKVD